LASALHIALQWLPSLSCPCHRCPGSFNATCHLLTSEGRPEILELGTTSSALVASLCMNPRRSRLLPVLFTCSAHPPLPPSTLFDLGGGRLPNQPLATTGPSFLVSELLLWTQTKTLYEYDFLLILGIETRESRMLATPEPHVQPSFLLHFKTDLLSCPGWP
jgi:hypothetical protein